MGRSALLGALMAAVAVALRLVFDLHYVKNEGRILRFLRLTDDEKSSERISYYGRFDGYFCVLPFAWCWFDIYSATLLATAWDHVIGYVLLVVFVGGRFRALQEIGHNAVHGALCRSRDWQWFLSDIFFQFPTFKRDMHARFVTHVKEHHKNPNQPIKDPNLMRIIAGGMVPNISEGRFYFNLLYPLTPLGFWVGLRTMAQHSTLYNRNIGTLFLRIATVAGFVGGFIALAGWKGLVLGYVVPLFVSYPLYTWLSLLSEHRWFVASDPGADRRTMECTNCRPIDFPGVGGWVIRQLVYPLSDQYHLAHSLYPFVRWNYLPAIDRALKERDELYARYRSEGFLFGREGMPAALSELRERLTGARDWDRAPWSAQYARQPKPSRSFTG
ncbi:fatty acid desaturase family protein [Pendulispora albinea]|uniref:Fatty acid desaturase n=1 Tax=Pendulispora albinea TaxID=2741071 RepID=A0ABZ2M2D8_9BACT